MFGLDAFGGSMPDRVVRFGSVKRVVQCRCGEEGREGVLM
jgi:hypothetical protein